MRKKITRSIHYNAIIDFVKVCRTHVAFNSCSFNDIGFIVKALVETCGVKVGL